MTEKVPESHEPQTSRPVQFNLPGSHIDDLTAFALLDDNTLADELRDAVRDYLDGRKSDPTLSDQIRQYKLRFNSQIEQ